MAKLENTKKDISETSSAPKNPSALDDYEVLSPLKHDDALFEVGKTIQLSEVEASALVDLGVVQLKS